MKLMWQIHSRKILITFTYHHFPAVLTPILPNYLVMIEAEHLSMFTVFHGIRHALIKLAQQYLGGSVENLDSICLRRLKSGGWW